MMKWKRSGKMSEKRFKVDYEVGVLDTLTDEIITDCPNAEEVVNFLNNQADTIQILKKEIIQLNQRIEHWKQLYQTLYEKVEQNEE